MGWIHTNTKKFTKIKTKKQPQPIFSARCTFNLWILLITLSVRQSVRDKSEQSLRDRPMVSIESFTMRLLRNTLDHPIPETWGSQPQSKLASQITTKRCQIQRWFVLTAYGNIPSPYLAVPWRSRGTPSPKVVVIINMATSIGRVVGFPCVPVGLLSCGVQRAVLESFHKPQIAPELKVQTLSSICETCRRLRSTKLLNAANAAFRQLRRLVQFR